MQNNKFRYAFLVGSAKSGTTKLADLLDLHPQICLSSDKEPDTFATTDVSPALLSEYDKLFDSTSEVRIDASTAYSERLDSDKVAARLAEVDSNAKILYLVRDPAKRAWSSYWHYIRNGVEKREPMAAIEDPQSPHFVGSRYHYQMQQYEKSFSREQIRIIKFEDFIKHPEEILEQILAFLNVAPMALKEDESGKQTNQSYQWSGPAAFLKHVDPKLIQKATRALKKALPESLLDKVKSSTTKAVPSVSEQEYQRLTPLFADDYAQLEADYAALFIKPRR